MGAFNALHLDKAPGGLQRPSYIIIICNCRVDSVPRPWEHWISIFTVLAISRTCLELVFRLFCASSYIVTVHPLSLWDKTSPPPRQGARAETQATAHHPQHRRPLRGWLPTRTGHWKRNSFSFLFKFIFHLSIFQIKNYHFKSNLSVISF